MSSYDNTSTTSAYAGTRYRLRVPPIVWDRPWRWVSCPDCDIRVGIEPRLLDKLEDEGGTVHCGRGHEFSLDAGNA